MRNRKKIGSGIGTLCGVLASVGIAQHANATLLVYDGFGQSSDTAGSVIGGTTPATSPGSQSWTAQSGVTDNSFVNGALSFPASYTNAPDVVGTTSLSLNGNNNNPNGNVDRIPLSSPFGSSDASTAYYSLLVNVTDLTNIAASGENQSNNNVNNSYNYSLIASLSDSSGLSGGLGTQTSGVYFRAGTGENTFQLGVGANRAGVVWSGDYTVGTTLFVVGSFDNTGTDTSSLWIDPNLGQTSAPSADLTTTSGESGGFGDNKVSVFDVTSNPGVPTGGNGVLVDEVRVGTTFADVTPAALPEPASLSAMAMVGVGLLRRRRR